MAQADTSRIQLRFLVGLRWAVFVILAVTLPLDERWFGFHVRYAVALPTIALLLGYNAYVRARLRDPRPISDAHLALGTAADVVAIGVVLAASGGAANPLSAVLLVDVALAASLLSARTTFAISALAAGVFAGLFALPSDACCQNAFSAHLYGMWLAFVFAAGLVAFFVTRVRIALEQRGREIEALRRKADEAERFAALGTLAAGTAHELATPLGTIAVIAGELPRDDAKLIQAQVARCREILQRMQGATGPRAGSSALGIAVESATAAWRAAHPGVAVELRAARSDARHVALSDSDVEAALWSVLDNALHATRAAGSGEPIVIEVGSEGGPIVRVEDAGTGVAPAVASRAGEPFLTTKEPGEGMGLGLYVVRSMLGVAGGSLEIAERKPRGTRVTLRFAEVRG